jgi:hypothetical protein
MAEANKPHVVTTAPPQVEFPCEEWLATRTPQGELVSVEPIPGTWTLIAAEDRRRFADKGMNIKAFFACPRCRQMGIIPEGFKPPTELGDAKLATELHCRKCRFTCRVILKNWDKRRLYCACYQTYDGKKYHTHKEYFHAEYEGEAEKFFWAQHSLLEVANLIGIAPVIGFFLQDNKTDQVLVV